MEKKKIEGILKKSNEVRNELLSKKIDRNPQYLGEYNTLFGEEFSVAERLEMPLMNGLNLYDYYHSEDSMLGSALNKVYFPDGMEPEKTYLDDVKELNLYNYTHEEDSRYKDMISDRYFSEGIIPTNDYLQSVKENNLYNFTHEENSAYKDFIKDRYFDNGVNANGEYGSYTGDGELHYDTHSAKTDYVETINHKYFDNRETYDTNDASLLEDTHSASTEYAETINHKYIDNRETYDIGDASMLEDTHSEQTEYSEEINHKYIDNKGYYDINDASILEDTHSAKTEYVEKINNQYIDNKGYYDANDASLLEDTHDADTEYSEKIDNQYIDNKGNYSDANASLLNDTHSAKTEYVEKINNQYIDNKGYYDVDDASLLEDTHSAKTEYSENINHQYVDSKVEYRNNDDLLNYTLGENLESETIKARKNVRGNKAKTQSENDKYVEEIFNKYFNFGRAIKVESVGDSNHKNWQGEYGYDNAKLLEDTHSANTEYSENINRTYGNWNQNYIQYLDEVLGMDAYSRHVDYINNLLAGHYITNALREVEVGVIRNYSVGAAMAGLNTTNKNNMSGKDTTLGTITNYMYSHSLYYGAIFNSDRKSNEKYLTPNLFNWYGNNLANVYELSDIAKIGVNDYRLVEDPGAEVKIIHDFSDNISANQLNLRYLTEAIDKGEEYYSKERPKAKHTKIGTDSYLKVKWDEQEGSTKFGSSMSDDTYSIDTSKYNQTPTMGVYVDNEIVKGIDDSGTSIEYRGYYLENDGSSYKKITSENKDSLLNKTQQLFNNKKIQTMIGRFCSYDGDKDFGIIDTARSKQWGNAHGRNLMTRDGEKDLIHRDKSGYVNPYCRDWTVFNQYSKVKNLIRPFTNDDGDLKTLSEIQSVMQKYRSQSTVTEVKSDNTTETKIIDGGARLGEYSVLNNNGFVNIAPSSEDKGNINIEKCMFSLENLAWKDITLNEKVKANISQEQIGPNGGRIMWFPPYGLNFQENLQVNWNDNTFIGRGEKVYTYTDTVRTGSLSFYLLIDHPAIINSMVNLDETTTEINDPDGEILRFFAGCSIPEIPEKPDNNEDKINVNNKYTKKGEIKFYTYFPNNYSGSVTKSKDGKTGLKLEDADWWKYILLGNNAGIYDKEYWNGYEMTNNGITIKYDDVTKQQKVKKSWMKTTLNCNNVLGDKDSLIENPKADAETGEYCYKYRVDYDRTQILDNGKADTDNYKDTKSLCLNSKFNADIHKNADYTFSEIIYVLLSLGKIKSNGSTSVEESGQTSVEESGQTTEKDEIKKYLENNGLIRMDECKKLGEILSSSTTGVTFSIDSIVVDGSATQRDSAFSNMLAIRRANSIKSLFSEYNGEVETSGEMADFVNGQKASNNISSDSDKKQRCVFTTIKYEITSIEGFSNSDPEATNEDTASEQVRKQKMFDEWFEKLVGYSELMNDYNISLPEGEYGDELKVYMDRDEYSYNLEDYQSPTDWIDFINEYVSEQTETTHLVPPCCISGNSFMDLLSGLTPLSDAQLEDKKVSDDKKSDYANISGTSLQANSGYSESISGLNNDIAMLKSNISAYTAEINSKNGEITGITASSTTNSNRIKVIENQLEHWDNKYGEKAKLKSEKKNLEKANEKLEKEKEKISKEISELKDKINDDRIQISENTKTIEEYNQKIEDNNTIIADSTQKFNEQLDYKVIPIKYLLMFYDIIYRNSNFDIKQYKFENCKDGYWKYGEKKIEKYKLPVLKYKDETKTEVVDGTEYNLSFNYLRKDYLVINKIYDLAENTFYYVAKALLDDIDKYETLCELLFINDATSRAANVTGDTSYDALSGLVKECLYKYKDSSKIQIDGYKNEVIRANGIVDDTGMTKDEKVVELKKSAEKIVNYTSSYSNEIIDDVKRAGDSASAAAKQNKAKESAQNTKLREKAIKEQEEAIDQLERDAFLYTIYGRGKSTRYETEAEYFKKLDKESPLVFRKLKEKFQYFNPAFHSISPEGFNARLNFLQQCTRQGSTYEATSDANTGARPAGNLAFGRMPVCVLRIGDFIKTRVIINSINIDYNMNGDMQWDLNPEGIGVQPMYAKVSLNVTLLGGQSLAGPISRLQNAVSFNYYANTEVYDDRADIIRMENHDEIYQKINNMVEYK